MAASAAASLALSAGAAAQLADGLVLDPSLPIESSALYLQTGTVDLSQPRRDLAAAVDAAEAGARHVIHLDGPMTPERRARLLDAGIDVIGYLPVNAFVARIQGGDPVKAGGLEFVRWHGEFETAWKLAPDLAGRGFVTEERQAIQAAGQAAVVIALFADADVAETVALIEKINGMARAELFGRESVGGVTQLTARVDLADLAEIAASPAVQFIEHAPEVTLRNATTRWIVQSNVLNVTPLYDRGLRGEGQIVGIMDGRPSVTHCSFTDSNPIGPTHRKIVAYNSTTGTDTHGTHVAGTAVGDAGVNDNTRGVAYMGKFVFNTIPSFTEAAMTQRLGQHHSQGARVHTNSWGDDGTTQYNSLARGIDVFSHGNEDSLVLFAVTNGGSLRNPENAKNVLAVGASQDTPNQANHCTAGVGPTSDGRRKPEIYAPGCSSTSSNGSACGTTSLTGTSMACPAVAGTAMLVRQYYMDGFYPTGIATGADALTPSAALVKATLLNSTVDMTGVAGYPSNLEGWGRILIDEALHFDGDSRKIVVTDVRNADGLSTGETAETTLNVLTSGERLKVTLVWTDAPAALGASFASINDLDLEVVAPDSTVYKGNVFAGGVSVSGGVKDDRNNVEQVHLNNPASGPWTIRVVGAAVNQGLQGYALVVTGDVQAGPAPLTIAAIDPPTLLAPNTPTPFGVTINPRDDSLVADSARLYYRYGGGSFVSAPLAYIGGTSYTATLPGAGCLDSPEFYVVAEGVDTGVKTAPPGAPASFFSPSVGVDALLLADDMEIDRGWTGGLPGDTATTGQWVRVDPVGTAAQPEDDHTPGAGTMCWVTGQGTVGGALGANDVDNGFTTLLSPAYDLSAAPAARISYWRWYSNSTGAAPNTDVFSVDISNNDGATWTPVERVGPSGPGTAGGWIFHEFTVADLVAPTNAVRLRFIADDAEPGSIVEAAVDDFAINYFFCKAEATCVGDLDGDGAVGPSDLAIMLGSWGPGGGDSDLNGDGAVTSKDLAILLGAWGPCP